MRPAYPPMSWSHSPFLRSLLTLKIFACCILFQFTCHLPAGGYFKGLQKPFLRFLFSEYMRPAYPPMSWSHSPFLRSLLTLKIFACCILFSIHLSFACGRLLQGVAKTFSFYFFFSEYMRPAYPPMSWSHSPFLRSLLTLKIFACCILFSIHLSFACGRLLQGVAKTFSSFSFQ